MGGTATPGQSDQRTNASTARWFRATMCVWSDELGFDGAPTWADPQCNVPPNPDLAGASDQSADPHCTGAIQTEFVQMWGHLESRLADHPAVIGYDLLNEPWPTGPPGVFEQVYLMPLYERVAAAIREHDATTPIFFGPPLYSPAVPTVAVSPPDPNAVFAPHIYTETMFSGARSPPTRAPTRSCSSRTARTPSRWACDLVRPTPVECAP